jgi:hypothetical protein
MQVISIVELGRLRRSSRLSQFCQLKNMIDAKVHREPLQKTAGR